MKPIHWVDDDVGYEKWLAEHPQGFVANLNRQPHVRYFRIHRASHRLPDRSNAGSINPRTGNNYSKVTSDRLAELIAWCQHELPNLVLGEVNFCKTCKPDSLASLDYSPTSDPHEYKYRADQLLAHGPVPRPAGILVPEAQASLVTQFCRDPYVRAWVLQRASGICELCTRQAPFVTENDAAYLEAHHLQLLAEGGADTPDNAAALCPNCHREIHYGKDRIELRTRLAKVIAAKEGRLS